MPRKKINKKQIFESKIQDTVNQLLRGTSLGDPRLQFVSITRVDLLPDYSEANLFWDTYDDAKRGDAKAAILNVESRIRALLASAMKVRHTPRLHFAYDSQFHSEKEITDILEREKKSGKFLNLPENNDSDQSDD